MPAPNLAHLQADPALLLPWLNDNLLQGGYLANVPNPPGTAWVSITPSPNGPHAVNSHGRPMDVYRVRTDGHGAHDAVPAYVCNYTAGGVHSVDLAHAGDFCFTTNLNGCTFGVGPVAGAGRRRVTHANTGGNTVLQRAQVWGSQGVAPNSPHVALLEPAEYRRLGGGGNLNATVFGVRTGVLWRFYFQLYTAVGGGNFQVHGVFPILHA